MLAAIRPFVELFADVDAVFDCDDAMDPAKRQMGLARCYRAWRWCRQQLELESSSAASTRWVWIYALLDPETSEVRYIGKSSDPATRMRAHRRATGDSYRDRWVRKLAVKGMEPMMVIVDEVPEQHWQDRERFWIEEFRSEGHRLTNTHPGGGAGIMSSETRARMSAAHVGVPWSPVRRAAMDSEKQAAAARRLKGTKRGPITEEHRAALSRGQRARRDRESGL